ncbi:DUF3592 domain-containing protein [Streptomyces atratus]|jgi:hypothetical protein|uniref:DUF3592 domain-containing protein n=1 Tax=Streptomyces atratus TaxID=1893 RepID=A0A1K2ASP7_STRAR|nr:DUF3592 domain-containing protein [Streptomyces atratus]SFX89482.1 hypothetical protein SAMN02787144_1007258 [Streptomyces atratus]
MVVAAVYFVVAVGAAVLSGRNLDRHLQGPRLRAIWAGGRTAEARCTAVRTEEAQDAEGGFVLHSHPTLEFRTGDGRTVSFEERQSRPTPAEGDFVTVHYSAANPQDATTRAPSFGIRHARTVITAAGCFFALVSAVVIAVVA